ncbi:tyrosine-type recombinase/integrase [Anaerotruncus colihominis]|nr:tyrosine-type recombinase/integrase [Anaerotruncus colihominis]
MLGTGLRVSELYGLTKQDVDFKTRCIYIDHQIC